MIAFDLRSSDGRARRGRMVLPRGVVETPAFMPVGTAGSIKSVTTEEVRACGADIVLGNTYHLYLRPGHERIERLGGLHRFMRWSGPILSDSGGYQVFSMAKINRIDDDGVRFRSHLDGSEHDLTPELSMRIQAALGSDIAMVFDDCPALPATREQIERAVDRTSAWAERSRDAYDGPGNLFGIVQGGTELDLRERSAEALLRLDFPGYAIGGVSVGETEAIISGVVGETAALLPRDRPRYLMGVGRPEDLVEGVARGVDLFDCVMPTRHARNGQIFTARGKFNIKRAEFAEDARPLDPDDPCPLLDGYTRAYARHLFLANEHLIGRILTLQNLWYYLRLMRGMREAIEGERFEEFRDRFYAARGAEAPA